jgi:asparagine synthetase B (glutamine-hydrolysing)
VGADELFNGYPQLTPLLDITSKDELIEEFLKITKIFPNEWLKKTSSCFGYSFSEIKNKIQQTMFNEAVESCAGGNLLRELLIKYYLIPCLLRDADNNSMYNSIELRVPYLDKDILEYSLSFRYDSFIINNENKFLIKHALNKLLKTEYKKIKEGFTLNYKRLLSYTDVIFPISDDIIGYRNWCLKNIRNWCLYNGYKDCYFDG